MSKAKQDRFAVIFDMDGVLVDSNPYHKKALQAFTAKHGYQLGEEELVERIYGRTNKEWLTNLFGDSLSGELLQQYAEEKEALYRKLFEHDIDEVPGLQNFLDELRSAGIPMAIATSAPRINVDFVLGKLGLHGYFDEISDDSEITHSKPHPEIYLLTANKLGYEPKNCIVFEDSISGVQSGVAADTKVIGIKTTHTDEELEGTVFNATNFNELDLRRLRFLFKTS